jgi:hypothetical protein
MVASQGRRLARMPQRGTFVRVWETPWPVKSLMDSGIEPGPGW